MALCRRARREPRHAGRQLSDPGVFEAKLKGARIQHLAADIPHGVITFDI